MTLSIHCVPIEMTEVEDRDREVSLVDPLVGTYICRTRLFQKYKRVNRIDKEKTRYDKMHNGKLDGGERVELCLSEIVSRS